LEFKCAFFALRQVGSEQTFFTVYEKHLFITTCIEMQCTRPLSTSAKDIIFISVFAKMLIIYVNSAINTAHFRYNQYFKFSVKTWFHR